MIVTCFFFLQTDPGDMPAYTEGGDDLPAGYSQYLAEVVKREYEELAAHNDKLSEIDKRVKAWENTVKGAIETAVSLFV